ncbi:SEC-C metal-binding domain-containing protein [Sporosarcina thermotolerans]
MPLWSGRKYKKCCGN